MARANNRLLILQYYQMIIALALKERCRFQYRLSTISCDVMLTTTIVLNPSVLIVCEVALNNMYCKKSHTNKSELKTQYCYSNELIYGVRHCGRIYYENIFNNYRI